jgi:hypothetical protein
VGETFITLYHLIDWILVIGLLIGLPLLSRPSVRKFVGPPLTRLLRRTLAELRPVSEPDPEEDDLWNVLRRQQLIAHTQRLQRILATDEYMSATRQIANRIAYRQLLHDLKEIPIPDVWGPMPAHATASRWNSSTLYPSTGRPEGAPKVEILEIGWRTPKGRPSPSLRDERAW